MKRQRGVGSRMRLVFVRAQYDSRLVADLRTYGVRHWRFELSELRRFGIFVDDVVGGSEIQLRFVEHPKGNIMVRWESKDVYLVGYNMYLCRSGFERGTGLTGPRHGVRRYVLVLAGNR